MTRDYAVLTELESFLEEYRDKIARFAQGYPRDSQYYEIDYQRLWRHNPELADYLIECPDDVLDVIPEALDMIDIPLDIDLSNAQVGVSNVEDAYVHRPDEIRSDQGMRYIGLEGTLERVTTPSDVPRVLEYECQRCKTKTQQPQPEPIQGELLEPHQCQGCERQGPFNINHDQSEWSDYAKVRIATKPSADSDTDAKLEGYVVDELIEGEDGKAPLFARAGEPVTCYGVLRRKQKDSRGDNQMLHDPVLEIRAIEYDRDNETVDVEKHREKFEELAARDNAVDMFAESIAPQLHATDDWQVAMEFAVAYLFGAPRIDIDKGPTFRGDLHMLIISDYGTGKSTFKKEIEAYSPKCISKSTTGLASGVGLTAAATKDDFGDGQWTLKPGLLVRANGGHLILDEIDKGPDELTEMNDALEGEQVVDVEKAGMSATYQSRTALLALGNPVDGRFNSHDSIAAQLDISESLLSRFDAIVTMEDTTDEEKDSKVAETHGKAYIEAQESEFGDREEMNVLDRVVEVDVGQAWIKAAREECNPILRYEQFEELKDWYAKEVRALNEDFADNERDMPVPATPRHLNAAMKMSIAFARCHLRDEVAAEDIERAKTLGKRLIRGNWDGEKFNALKNVSSATQQDRVKVIKEIIRDGDGLTLDQFRARAHERGLDPDKAEHELDNLKQQGQVYEPSCNEYRLT